MVSRVLTVALLLLAGSEVAFAGRRGGGRVGGSRGFSSGRAARNRPAPKRMAAPAGAAAAGAGGTVHHVHHSSMGGGGLFHGMANYFMFRSMFGGGHNRQIQEEQLHLENEMGQEHAKTDMLQQELEASKAQTAALEARMIALERK